MAAQRKAFFTSHEEGPKPYEVIRGIQWLQEQGQDALVVVATLDNLSQLSSSLGLDRVRRLKASETVVLGTNTRLTAATELKMVRSWAGPVLVLYPSKDLLDKVDGIAGVTSVLVIPWLKTDTQDWIKTWAAVELGAAEPSPGANPKTSDEAVLEAALNSLTKRVNVSTGLHHQGDKAAAIDLFGILRQAGVPFEAEEVKSILLSRFGWGPEQANQVRDLVADIQAGKRPRKHKGYDRPMWNPNILQMWQEESQQG